METWETFIEEHHDEYVALAAYYQQPKRRRLSLSDVKALAQAISLPPHNLTPERLWAAYKALDKSKVRGAGERKLADLVSLIRFAVRDTDELMPLAEVVRLRYELWLADQTSAGRTFTPQQRRWLDMVAEHMAGSLTIERDDFDSSRSAHKVDSSAPTKPSAMRSIGSSSNSTTKGTCRTPRVWHS